MIASGLFLWLFPTTMSGCFAMSVVAQVHTYREGVSQGPRQYRADDFLQPCVDQGVHCSAKMHQLGPQPPSRSELFSITQPTTMIGAGTFQAFGRIRMRSEGLSTKLSTRGLASEAG